MKKLATIVFVVLCVCTLAIPALAGYPEKPITYQIPFGPGGQSDLEARRQQPLLEKALGVKVIVQYKPGGGGSIGWANLISQKPDGYFISGINIPHIVLQPLARGNAGYETDQLKPIALFQATPIGLAVLKDSPFKNLKDLVTYAKENPDAIVCGGSGTWSGHHIAHLQFSKAAGIKMTYIPSKGAAKSVAAFLGGHVMALWGNSNDLVQHAEKIRVLAFGTREPFPNMPDAPTFESLGYKIYASIDRGAGAPPETPDEVIQVLEKAFLGIANDPKVKEQMKKDGFVPIAMGAAESKAYIAEKVVEWAPVVKEFKK
jgi:tripartite-type tricarboxylate transporter receptor subunit TctC